MSFKLTDDPSVVIYDRKRFIIQATGRGRISTIDLLVLTGLDQLLFMLKLSFSFLQINPS